MSGSTRPPERARLDFSSHHRSSSKRSSASNTWRRAKLIWLGALIGMAFYPLDAIIDSLLFDEGTLANQLLRPAPVEIWARLVVFTLSTLFAIYASRLLKHEHTAATRARMAEGFLASVIDNIPDMVFIKDANELRFVRVNAAGAKLLGFSTKELEGKNDYDFFPRPQAEFFTTTDRQVLTDLGAVEVEEEIETKRFGKRILHTKKVAILDHEGIPAYLLGISEDITRRKHAEAQATLEKERAERYLQISRAMIVGLDHEGRVEVINRRGCEILGYSEAEIVGRDWFETVIPAAERAKLHDVFQSIMAGDLEPARRFENWVVRKDGGIRYIAWNNSCLRDADGRIVGSLSSGQDITQRILAEQEAQRRQRDLAHMMRLSTMTEMASGMAHELNQPLAAIVSYCEAAMHMLRRDRPAADVDEVLKRATEQAHRAGDIIRRLRALVSKGAVARQPLKINDTIREVAGLMQWELRSAQLSLELRLTRRDPLIFADKVQIEQVLLNLLRNSIEALQEAAVLDGSIVLESILPDEHSVRVIVSDNGPGISAEVAERIFQPFQTTKTQGTGIGLSVSHSIIEAHGGTLWLDRSHHGGARFGFDLSVYEGHVDA